MAPLLKESLQEKVFITMQKRIQTLAIGFGLIALVLVGFLVISNKGLNRTSAHVLPIPFSSQAPNENWDRNEDCEEASITMANAYLTGNRSRRLAAHDAQKSIDALKAWENANIGYNEDTGVEATKAMAEGAFGLEVRKISNYSAEDLKQELRAGRPILLSINAHKLNNPKYRNSGPQYHMVVVRGYEGEAFIINDPGTDDGENNKYTFEVLKNAAADWNHKAKAMDSNSKIALVIIKNK